MTTDKRMIELFAVCKEIKKTTKQWVVKVFQKLLLVF
jgi:hypothetical protein